MRFFNFPCFEISKTSIDEMLLIWQWQLNTKFENAANLIYFARICQPLTAAFKIAITAVQILMTFSKVKQYAFFYCKSSFR